MNVVVVSDTSPIRALSFLGHLDLLSKLFGEVIVPTAVAAELDQLKPTEPWLDVSSVPSIRIVAPHHLNRVADLRNERLDAGEAEAIALAEELDAGLILIDERRAHLIATRAGLNTLGTLGILVQAKKVGVVDSVAPLIERLRVGLDFFVSEPLEAEVRRLAGE